MKKIKICFFADGESVHTQRWLREMAARGFEVILITRRPKKQSEYNTHVVEPGLRRTGWLFGALKIRRIVRKISPDIVHGHYITSYGMWAAISGVKPLVLTAWGSDILVSPKQNRLIRWLTGWMLRRADLITADSEDTLEEILGYSPQARLEQVQWGVDLNRIRNSASLSKIDVLNVVSLRNWTTNYNINLIFEAYADLRKAIPNYSAHLHLLGEGDQESSLKALAKSLGIESEVTFYGKVSEDRLLDVLSLADISVSVPSNDATAMSLLESMASGLPVVVSDLKANRQWIDETGGRIVPVDNKDAIAAALIELAQDAVLRGRMGMRNRAEIEKRASRHAEMDRMARLYMSLITDTN